MIHNHEVGSSSLPRATKAFRGVPVMLVVLVGLGLVACSSGMPSGSDTDPEVDHAAIREAISEVMDRQEDAWDHGDIDGFMEGYADDICFIGRGGMRCGRDSVTMDYRMAYPDAAAMGDLTFGVTEILPIATGHAWCTGTWSLVREQDTLEGGFSLLWERAGGEWLIVRDHSY